MQQKKSFRVMSHRGPYRVAFTSLARQRLPRADTLLFVVDKNVWDAFADVRAKATGTPTLVLEAKETTKTLSTVSDVVIPFFLEHNASRHSLVVACGGGIIQDIVSFACSITHRGIPWSFYPTTLLAQADSCIGSKSSINLNSTKNLLGTFYPAQSVVIDTHFLAGLAPADIVSGVGEIVKVHLLKGRRESARLLKRLPRILAREADALQEVIYDSLVIKKSFIEADEFDTGIRNLLNYGHGFGHALEAATRYRISHGLGVLYGMEAANRLSLAMGMLTQEEYGAMGRLITPYLLQRNVVAAVPFDQLLPFLKKDKKNERGELTFILTRGAGKMVKRSGVSAQLAARVWRRYQASLSQ